MTNTVRTDRDPAGGALPAGVERLQIWDPALRAVHWALALLVTATWLLAQFGPAKMTLHFWFGYAIIALLAFRLVWGLIGPRHARFSRLIHGPRATLEYIRGFARRVPSYWRGHNPMGGWSVVAMLALLVMQVATGLVSDPDDFINVGPLASEVSRATSRKALSLHHLGGTLILLLVLLHVGMILYYRLWKREDLIRPMITGWKLVRRR
ncbi:cytochrome B [Paracoccus suum]|uniref:Cytochrome B n=1 Tax=Paracoccus suum TaxID=2259340 RepID=A0A344PIY4_9RHOB|nr:cytochrome b/b6 domain-containing protein [Paracoccus suum]AXC49339.1 cytochrome B [Paracoccus suum]